MANAFLSYLCLVKPYFHVKSCWATVLKSSCSLAVPVFDNPPSLTSVQQRENSRSGQIIDVLVSTSPPKVQKTRLPSSNALPWRLMRRPTCTHFEGGRAEGMEIGLAMVFHRAGKVGEREREGGRRDFYVVCWPLQNNLIKCRFTFACRHIRQ